MAATFAFPCQECGAQNTVGWERGGKPCLCQHCGVMIEAPVVRADLLGGARAPEPAAPAVATTPSRIKFRCSQCRHLHRVEPELSGEVIACENCGSKLRVPPPRWMPNEGAAPPPKPPRPAAVSRPKPAPPRTPRPAPAPAPRPAPPAVDRYDLDAPMPAPLPPLQALPPRQDSVFVPRAGTAPGPVESPVPVKKRKRKKKRSSAPSFHLEAEGLLPIVAILGLVGLIAVFVPGARLPIGAIVAIVGLIVGLVGGCGILRAAWEEGAIHFLLCLFLNFYTIIFIIMFWSETKRYFALNVFGLILIVCGGVLMAWGAEVSSEAASEHGRPLAPRIACVSAPLVRHRVACTSL